MVKKDIKKLAEMSYNNNELNIDRVDEIVKHLNRKELRLYINSLKKVEKRKTVYIESASELNEKYKDELINLYGSKKVQFIENKDLLLGLRITENDMVYNLNLENSLQQFTKYLEKTL